VILIVTGGRDYFPTHAQLHSLKLIAQARGVTELVHGDARGVDRQVDSVFRLYLPDVTIKTFPYKAEHGRVGGPIRNSEMAAYAKGKPALCVAFPGGKGTADMVTKATRAGIEVLDWRDFK